MLSSLRLWPLPIVALWLVLDQWLKNYTIQKVPFYPAKMEVIPGFLALSYTTNTGLAWSLLDSAPVILAIVRLLVAVALIIYLMRTKNLNIVISVALALIIGGALGNAIDGIRFGYVVDMIYSNTLTAIYKPIFGQGKYDFPIFNLADTGVVSGVILLILANLFSRKPKEKIDNSQAG